MAGEKIWAFKPKNFSYGKFENTLKIYIEEKKRLVNYPIQNHQQYYKRYHSKYILLNKNMYYNFVFL